MYAIFASDVVLPVPFIPTNNIKNGSPIFFFVLINSTRLTLPAVSNSEDILEIKLSLMNFSILFLSTLEPTSLLFKSDFIVSTISLATSDSSREISNSKRTSSISFSLSSFSPRLFAADENALRSLSNIAWTWSWCPGLH